MGARPELARAQRDLSERIGQRRLAGLDGPAHGERAQALFAELGLTAELHADEDRMHPVPAPTPESAVG